MFVSVGSVYQEYVPLKLEEIVTNRTDCANEPLPAARRFLQACFIDKKERGQDFAVPAIEYQYSWGFFLVYCHFQCSGDALGTASPTAIRLRIFRRFFKPSSLKLAAPRPE
jgi:hypothetical protein